METVDFHGFVGGFANINIGKGNIEIIIKIMKGGYWVRQKEVRKRLNEYIANEGVTAKHIAKKINIFESVFSKFRQDKADLYPEQLDSIEMFLDTKQQQNN